MANLLNIRHTLHCEPNREYDQSGDIAACAEGWVGAAASGVGHSRRVEDDGGES